MASSSSSTSSRAPAASGAAGAADAFAPSSAPGKKRRANAVEGSAAGSAAKANCCGAKSFSGIRHDQSAAGKPLFVASSRHVRPLYPKSSLNALVVEGKTDSSHRRPVASLPHPPSSLDALVDGAKPVSSCRRPVASLPHPPNSLDALVDGAKTASSDYQLATAVLPAPPRSLGAAAAAAAAASSDYQLPVLPPPQEFFTRPWGPCFDCGASPINPALPQWKAAFPPGAAAAGSFSGQLPTAVLPAPPHSLGAAAAAAADYQLPALLPLPEFFTHPRDKSDASPKSPASSQGKASSPPLPYADRSYSPVDHLLAPTAVPEFPVHYLGAPGASAWTADSLAIHELDFQPRESSLAAAGATRVTFPMENPEITKVFVNPSIFCCLSPISPYNLKQKIAEMKKSMEGKMAFFVLEKGFLPLPDHSNCYLHYHGEDKFKVSFTVLPNQRPLLTQCPNDQLVVKVINPKWRNLINYGDTFPFITLNQLKQSEILRINLRDDGISAAFLRNDPRLDGIFIQRRVIASQKITPKAFVEAIRKVQKREEIEKLPPLIQDLLRKMRTFFSKATFLVTPLDLTHLGNVTFEEKGDEIIPTLNDFIEKDNPVENEREAFEFISLSMKVWSDRNRVIFNFYLEEIAQKAQSGDPICKKAILFYGESLKFYKNGSVVPDSAFDHLFLTGAKS